MTRTDAVAQRELPLQWGARPFPIARPPVRTDAALGAERTAWVTGLLQAVLEVLAGDRSPAQLVRWLAPGVYADVLARSTSGRAPLARIRSVRIVSPAPGVLEVTALLDCGLRHRATTMRLERVDRLWRCTRLAIL